MIKCSDTRYWDQKLDMGRFVTGDIVVMKDGAEVHRYTDFLLKNNERTIEEFVSEYEPIDDIQVR